MSGPNPEGLNTEETRLRKARRPSQRDKSCELGRRAKRAAPLRAHILASGGPPSSSGTPRLTAFGLELRRVSACPQVFSLETWN